MSKPYHYVTVRIVMRDCESKQDATEKLGALMPHYPDENTVYMESWEVTSVDSSDDLDQVAY